MALRIVAKNPLYDVPLERLEALLKRDRRDANRRKRWLAGIVLTLDSGPDTPKPDLALMDVWNPRYIQLWKRDDAEITEMLRNEARIIRSLEKSANFGVFGTRFRLKPARRFGPKRHPVCEAFRVPRWANRRYRIDYNLSLSAKQVLLSLLITLMVVAGVCELRE